jgi:hypothetical protein
VARALALDVSDAGLVGLGSDGLVLGPSPGTALVEGSRPVHGEEARRRSRLVPRLVATDCWARLDAEPLGPPFPEGLSRADVVHAHLESLWSGVRRTTGEVVLAVPGTHDERQLGVLLGIAQALGMPVTGMVDAAVAAASAGFPGERLLHVDLGLRHAAVTEIRQGHEVARERVARIDRWGQDEVEDALMRGAADAFVTQARFDPLHDAETEQALFDALPAWLASLEKHGRATLSLPAAGREASLELRRDQVLDWTARLASELSQQVSVLKRAGEPATVLVSAPAARLPGLVERLGAIRGVELALLPVQAAAAGALRERLAVRSTAGAVRFLTRLPRAAEPEGTVGGQAVMVAPRPAAPDHAGARGRRATHVLLGCEARAVTAEPLVLGTAPPEGGRSLRLSGETSGVSRAHCRLFEAGGGVVLEDLSTWGTFVNGERVSGRAVVEAGDRIRVGSPGIELLLVAAVEG